LLQALSQYLDRALAGAAPPLSPLVHLNHAHSSTSSVAVVTLSCTAFLVEVLGTCAFFLRMLFVKVRDFVAVVDAEGPMVVKDSRVGLVDSQVENAQSPEEAGITTDGRCLEHTQELLSIHFVKCEDILDSCYWVHTSRDWLTQLFCTVNYLIQGGTRPHDWYLYNPDYGATSVVVALP